MKTILTILLICATWSSAQAGDRQIMFGGEPYTLEQGSGPTMLLSIPRGSVATGSTSPNGDITLIPSGPPVGIDLPDRPGESPELFLNRIMPPPENPYNWRRRMP